MSKLVALLVGTALSPREALAKRMPVRSERGLTTAEYAVGVVMVVIFVGIVIAALKTNWMGALVQHLVKMIFDLVGNLITGVGR